ncbi:MAG: fibronectin type III domain-containing protein [Actinomycetota bacterium]
MLRRSRNLIRTAVTSVALCGILLSSVGISNVGASYPGPITGPNLPDNPDGLQVDGVATSVTPMDSGQTADPTIICGFSVSNDINNAPTHAQAFVGGVASSSLLIDSNGCVTFTVSLWNASSSGVSSGVAQVYLSIDSTESSGTRVLINRGAAQIKVMGVKGASFEGTATSGSKDLTNLKVNGQLSDGTLSDGALAVGMGLLGDNHFPTGAVVKAFDYTAGTVTMSLPATLSGSRVVFVTTAQTVGATVSFSIKPSVPNAPSSVVARAGYHLVNVSWTAPADGGSPITSYRVTAKDTTSALASHGNGSTCTTDDGSILSCLFSSLLSSDRYSFSVKATNALGTSSSSVPSNVTSPTTVATVPFAPTKITTSPSHLQITVTWNAGVSNGSTIKKYYVYAKPGPGLCSTADLTCTITGLTDGTFYTFSIVAQNSIGYSAVSQASNPVAPVPIVPDPPTAVTATSLNGALLVSWKAPGSDGGSPITAYTVTGNDGSSCVDAVPADAVDPLSCTVTNLTNGTPYTFTVVATNAVGDGSASDPSSPVSPQPVRPDAPTDLSATYDLNQNGVTVTWTAPGSDGGAAITSYRVTSSPDGKYCTSSQTSCLVVGLTVGRSYTFTAEAVNSAGSSPASGQSNSVTPAQRPGAPRKVVAKAGFESALVTWQLPISNGGSSITSFTVTAVDVTNALNGGQTCTDSSGSLSCRVEGLTDGDSYTFSVTATNSVGTGDVSRTSNTVSPGPSLSDAPTRVAGSYQSGVATVTWIAPANNGGSSITGYKVTSSPGSATCTSTTQLLCLITGLAYGGVYTFTVVATNASGDSLPSQPSAAITATKLPDPVQNVAATTSENQQSTVSWTAAAGDGVPVLSYTATSNPGGLTCSSATSISCVVTGLTNGVVYTFSVVARNKFGDSIASAPSNSVIPATVPTVPLAVRAIADSKNRRVTVTWVSSLPQGSQITAYSVTSVPTSSGCTVGGSATTCDVTNLVVGTNYVFTVTATNAIGSSAGSDPAPPVRILSAPLAVTAVSATAHLSQVSVVSWIPTVSASAALTTGYVVTSRPDGATCATTFATTCVVRGLKNGTSYTFSVVATNDVGSSPTSLASSAIIPSAPPTEPMAVIASRSGSDIVVTWSPPANDGGSTIISYVVSDTSGSSSCTWTTGPLVCTIATPVPGLTYSFTATASNANGQSPDSVVSNVILMSQAPAAPSGVVAIPDGTTATISWNPPSTDGGSQILSYTASSQGAAFSCTVNGDTTCQIQNLVLGTSYSFSVIATNAVGDSGSSEVSDSVVAVTAPLPPSNVSVVGGDGQVTVTWAAVVGGDLGGSPLNNYVVISDPDSQFCVTQGDTSCVITNLTNGQSYTFTVWSYTDAGSSLTGTTSDPVVPDMAPVVRARTAGVHPRATLLKPDAPATVTAIPRTASAIVSWTVPSAGGGAATGYTVTSSPGAKTCVSTSSLTCTVTGLTNGRSYVFRVTANNSAGSSTSLPSKAVVPSVAPSAPTQIQVISSDGETTVNWLGSKFFGQSPVTSYVATSSPGNLTCTAKKSPCVISGLTNGITYTFRVVASSAAATSVPSVASASTTPSGLPSTPGTPNAHARDSSAVVSFSEASANGAELLRYEVVASPGGFSCVTLQLSCVVSGLTNGTSYTFVVSAVNANGASTPSEPSNSVMPSTPPDAPTVRGVTPSNKTVSVSWDAPLSDGGTPVTGYVVTSSPGGLSCESVALTCDVSGLTNGTTYTFTVIATTAAGSSQPSISSSSATPFTVPDAPLDPTSESHDQSLTVQWALPIDNGGSLLTGFDVVGSPGNLHCAVAIDVRFCVFDALTNGTLYSFSIRASNAAGSSDAVTVSGTPFTAPQAPSAVVGTSHTTTSSLVSWAAPENDGGSTITSYVVTSTPGSLTCTSAVLSCVVTGLTNGVGYTFTVVAKTQLSTSLASPNSALVYPSTVPSAPRDVLAVPGTGTALISWSTPLDTGGAAVSNYLVTSTPGNRTCSTEFLTCSIDGLTNGLSYTFSVVATNASGDSASAVSTAVVPATVPDPPVNPIAVSDDGRTAISWTSPTFTGGRAITSYTVTSEPGGFTCTTSTLTCTITGLTNGVTYVFAVIATNEIGDSTLSLPSDSVTPTTPPGPPTSVVAALSGSTITLTWVAPADNGGSDIASYTVTSIPPGFSCVTETELTCDIPSGHVPAGIYSFQVVARNSGASSVASALSNGLDIVATPPTAPTSVVAVLSPTTITVSWVAPTDNGGTPIAGYTVTSLPAGFSCTTTTALSCVISHQLVRGDTYVFYVTARNAGATSELSAESNSLFIAATPPSAPRNVVAVLSSSSITVSWLAPTDNGGTVIVLYTVTSEPAGFSCTTTTARSCVIPRDHVALGTYVFYVTARNAGATSELSAASNSVAITQVSVSVGPPSNLLQLRLAPTVYALAWHAPGNLSALKHVYYVVTVTQTHRQFATTLTYLTASGFNARQFTTFTVVAICETGRSVASRSSRNLPALQVFYLGSRGAPVKWLQLRFGLPVTGIFTPLLQARVKNFQKNHHLRPDGVVGAATWLLLF